MDMPGPSRRPSTPKRRAAGEQGLVGELAVHLGEVPLGYMLADRPLLLAHLRVVYASGPLDDVIGSQEEPLERGEIRDSMHERDTRRRDIACIAATVQYKILGSWGTYVPR